MLELHIANKDATSGTICLSWCVSKELLQELADKGVANPLLVICIAPAYQQGYHLAKEHRQVVPLKDLIAYCELHCAGQNQIRAFVSAGSRKETYALLEKKSGVYTNSLLDWEGGGWAQWIAFGKGVSQSRLGNTLLVDVPKECFAKEPWDKSWVNWLFRDGTIDQCHHRQRRLFAWTLQVPMMMGYWLMRLAFILVSLLIGARGFSFKYLLHPLTYDMDNMLNDGIFGGGTIFVRRIPELEEGSSGLQEVWWVVRKFCLLPFMPAIWLSLFFLHRAHILGTLSLVICGIAVVITIIAMIAAGTFSMLWYSLMDKLTSSKLWYLDKEEMDLLVCGDKKAMQLSDLPAKKKTIKLRFYDLKSRVCRPFSR